MQFGAANGEPFDVHGVNLTLAGAVTSNLPTFATCRLVPVQLESAVLDAQILRVVLSNVVEE